jgi:hypothetical protein
MKAIITKNGKKIRFIEDAENINGYLGQFFLEGVGKVIRIETWSNGFDDCGEDPIYEKYIKKHICFFNSSLIEDDKTFKDELTKKLGHSPVLLEDIIGTKYEKYLIKFGNNDGGLTVEFSDTDEERNRELGDYENQIKNKEVCINFSSGHPFGLIAPFLPLKIYSLIKEYSTYHKGDESDLEWAEDIGFYDLRKEELKGTFYSEGAIDALYKAGYRVSYNGIELNDSTNLQQAETKYELLNKERKEAAARYSNKKDLLRNQYIKIFRNAECMTEEEVRKSGIEEDRNIIMFYKLGIEGHNIYGGGVYLLQKDNYLFIIRNNGMDGDDWSRSNFKTGGAGAIAFRTTISEEVKGWLKEAAAFENSKV